MSDRPYRDRQNDSRGGRPQRPGGPRRDDARGDYRDRREGSGDRDNRDRRPGGERRHAQRAGSDRSQQVRSGPQRSGFREERLNKRLTEPDLPDDIEITDLDPMVLQDLKVLSKDNADAVARHMIMAATLMQDDPKLALRHARAAKDRAGRVAVARETNGIAAYHAGEWKEALSELRAARRMSGGPGLMAVMADCERGLGRPEKAVELGRSEEARLLDREGAVELGIVIAGARLDMSQPEAAVVTLQRLNPDQNATGAVNARLFYAYADALAAAGRTAEAVEWFQHADKIDEEEMLDAADRIAELS
ncbi:hypothetical protein NYP18_06945 [Corynebacterium sp. YIM 101645]|uniref:TPR-repeat-containing protein n=1 Tax=Corynebacterium lemuris TaxID=1859292 RepID=A0ABT2FZC8_9CORY|nr:hypothetical protein [Corynebacterium lemuris]MCS5479392.1 hypothetical protein [Corynebacterium lemuris]